MRIAFSRHIDDSEAYDFPSEGDGHKILFKDTRRWAHADMPALLQEDAMIAASHTPREVGDDIEAGGI